MVPIWYQELAGFNFTLEQKRGKENCNADALSLSTHITEAPPPEENKYKSMSEVKGRRVRWNAQMYKPLTQNIRVGCLVWYVAVRLSCKFSKSPCFQNHLYYNQITIDYVQ